MALFIPLFIIGILLFSIVLYINMISLLKIIILNLGRSVKSQTIFTNLSVAYI